MSYAGESSLIDKIKQNRRICKMMRVRKNGGNLAVQRLCRGLQSPRANAILAKMFEKLDGWSREFMFLAGSSI